MAVGVVCPSCGRTGAGKSNLITMLDITTQDIYLQEDGYFFANPYWSMKTLPCPRDFDSLIADLHRPVKGERAGGGLKEVKLKYFTMYEFDYRWFTTNKILCRLPDSTIDLCLQMTFFLRPFNEKLPDWSWVVSSMKALRVNAGWEWDKKENKWVNSRQKFIHQGRDQHLLHPNSIEWEFVTNTETMLAEDCLNKFTHRTKREREKPKDEGGIYNQEWLDEFKEKLRPYESEGEYNRNVIIPLYRTVLEQFLITCKVYIDHVEKKIKNTKGELDAGTENRWNPHSFQLFRANSITKINDDRLLIRLERDMIAEWYPKLLDTTAVWKFQTRPLSRELIENFHGKGQPLRSCIFCPSHTGSSTSTDDRFFDWHPIIVTKFLAEGKFNPKRWMEKLSKEEFEDFCRDSSDELQQLGRDKIDEEQDIDYLKTLEWQLGKILNVMEIMNIPKQWQETYETVIKHINESLVARDKKVEEKAALEKLKLEAEREKRKVTEKVWELQTTLDNLRSQINQSETNTNVNALRSTIEALDTDVKKKNDKIETLTKDINELIGKITSLESRRN